MTLRDALLTVIELAEQNVIDEREYPREHKEQIQALKIVWKLRKAIPIDRCDRYARE